MLANERTLLAAIRTALALMLFGMAIIQFFPGFGLMLVLGWFFMVCGVAVVTWGIRHFQKVGRWIRNNKASQA